MGRQNGFGVKASSIAANTPGEVIETTGEHPFFVSGKGFVEAKDPGIGTSLVTRAGPKATVVGIECKESFSLCI